MSTGNKQQPPVNSGLDDRRQAETPPGGRPAAAAPLTIEDVRARLSEGLLPGEDILFYDPDRFVERRPAQPSEAEVYEPPRQLGAPDACATPTDAEKVVLQVSGNTAPPDLPLTQALGPTEPSRDDKVLRRVSRARTKDLAYSFFVVSAVSLMGLWFLIWQRESDAHRKVPSTLVPPPAALAPQMKIESPPSVGPTVPLMDDNAPATASTSGTPAPSVSTRAAGVTPPRSSADRQAQAAPKAPSSTKRPPRPSASAEPTAVDPDTSIWIHQER